MLILVEGSDCARKTTFVNRLADRLARLHPGEQLDVYHAGPPTKHPLDEYVTPLLDYRPLRDRHVLCDRWHLGETIYPAIFGRESKFDLAVQAHTELFLRSRGAFLVLVDAQPENVVSCLESRGDELVRPDQASVIIQEFRSRATASLLPTLVLDGYDVTEEQLDYVLTRARAVEHISRGLNGFTTYVGSRIPRLLLLGEVRHGHRKGDLTDLRPAFLPYGSTSGHYLLSQLIKHHGYGVVNHIGLANACDEDDHEQLWTVLRKPRTVALGRQAQRRTPWAAVRAHHPQFVRRFRHTDGGTYVREILTGSAVS